MESQVKYLLIGDYVFCDVLKYEAYIFEVVSISHRKDPRDKKKPYSSLVKLQPRYGMDMDDVSHRSPCAVDETNCVKLTTATVLNEVQKYSEIIRKLEEIEV